MRTEVLEVRIAGSSQLLSGLGIRLQSAAAEQLTRSQLLNVLVIRSQLSIHYTHPPKTQGI